MFKSRKQPLPTCEGISQEKAPVDFLIKKDGVPHLAIVVVRPNTYRGMNVIGTKRICDLAGIRFSTSLNKKVFADDIRNNITWARWYFPVINTDAGIHELDLYMQDCIRYIAYGSYSKKRFKLRYETIKEWGYISLVNEYYSFRKEQ